jgi:hypothetical protein
VPSSNEQGRLAAVPYWKVLAPANLLLLFTSAPAISAELKSETLSAWDAYVAEANSKMAERARSQNQFLWVNQDPERNRRARAGEIVTAPVGEHVPRRVPSGLIHHWIGAAFIPNVAIADVFSVTRNYDRYDEVYTPSVLNAKQVSQSGGEDHFSLLLRNKSVLSKTALDAECRSSYKQLDEKRWLTTTATIRVQEIRDYGQPGEQKLGPDQGTGYIWRLYSASRLEERDGGVYIEVEAIALSRDIPGGLHWLIDPIVRRVSRSSLQTSLQQTGDAVRSTAAAANRPGNPTPQRTPVSGSPFSAAPPRTAHW